MDKKSGIQEKEEDSEIEIEDEKRKIMEFYYTYLMGEDLSDKMDHLTKIQISFLQSLFKKMRGYSIAEREKQLIELIESMKGTSTKEKFN